MKRKRNILLFAGMFLLAAGLAEFAQPPVVQVSREVTDTGIRTFLFLAMAAIGLGMLIASFAIQKKIRERNGE